MEFAEVNYLAVGLATVLAFTLGMLWYSPLLFARPWMAGHGYKEEDFEGMEGGMTLTYGISFLCWAAMATVLAAVAPSFGDGVGATLATGLVLWLGFSATVGLTNNLFSDKPRIVWVIDAGYQAVSVILMAVVIGLWP